MKIKLVEGELLPLSIDLGPTKPGEVYEVNVEAVNPLGEHVLYRNSVRIMRKTRIR